MAADGMPRRATMPRMLRIDVDRDARTPPYRQVAEHLADAIRRGDYPPGTLPRRVKQGFRFDRPPMC